MSERLQKPTSRWHFWSRSSPEELERRAEEMIGHESVDLQPRIDLALDLRRARRYSSGRRLLMGVPEGLKERLHIEPLEASERLQLRRQLEWSLDTLAVCAIHDKDFKEPEKILKLARQLQDAKIQFNNLARRLLADKIWTNNGERHRLWQADRKLYLEIRAQLALCTALDFDLPADYRLAEALDLLKTEPDLDNSEADFDTLRRGGLIHKRKWVHALNKSDLERARVYYQKACDKARTEGNLPGMLATGVEAAYLLDQLAVIDANEGAEKDAVERRQAAAGTLRSQLFKELGKNGEDDDFSKLINLAHLHMGLSDSSSEESEHRAHLEKAQDLLVRARNKLGVPGWQVDRAAQELIDRARLRQEADPAAEGHAQALQAFLSKEGRRQDQPALAAAAVGKVGLALSGGGFRAALFHLGVLARLAEIDVLRHVEALSCVSGGSIVGAHYYLKLRHLLRTTPEDEIDRSSYIGLVEELIDEFLAGVQNNIRTRVVVNPWLNLKMLWPGSSYSRTDRVADLIERHLFRRVSDGHDLRGRWRQALWPRKRLLDDLKVKPSGSPKDPDGHQHFHPRFDNWKRRCKVPRLILNATSLNTGHNWQFTAGLMGEPPAAIDTAIDANERLRRLYLWEAPRPHDKISLGKAVAASACVPGLFDPLSLQGLYDGKGVRLVDGGVFDNQGIVSLLAEDCKVVLVSDASGQIESKDHPGGGLLNVPLRSNSILMARIRQAQYQDLAARRRAQLLRSLSFVHLKKGLRGEQVDWVGCDDPRGQTRPQQAETKYRIPEEIQRKLANIRTDLDSFCDIEAYALMYSGYRMACEDIRDDDIFAVTADRETPLENRWKFLVVEGWMSSEPDAGEDSTTGPTPSAVRLRERGEKILQTARHRVFKIWRLRKGMLFAALGSAVAGTVAVGFLDAPVMLQGVNSGLLGLLDTELRLSAPELLLLLLSLPVLILFSMLSPRFSEKLGNFLQMAVLGTFGMLLAWIHLAVFDPLYLRYGKLTRADSGLGDQRRRIGDRHDAAARPTARAVSSSASSSSDDRSM